MNVERLWRPGAATIAAVALLAATLAMAAFVSSARAADQSVSIQNLAYNPGSVTIEVGDTVTWTNNESGGGIPHTVASNTSGLFDSGQLAEGATFQHTFNTAGTFAYHCNVHPDMSGTVVVQAASGGNGAQATNTPSAPSAGTGLAGSDGGAAWLLAMLAGAVALLGGATMFALAGRWTR